jgi:ATP-dependent DNA helicase RecG
VPFYPHEHLSRRSDLGLLDYSAQPVEGADFSSLDPLEFERLRQTIPRRGGDRALLDLADEDTAKALRLVESDGNKLVPNVAGLLLLGREEAITRLVPTHEVHFQVIDAQGDVRVNDTFRGPLLHVLEDLEARFNARNEEREVLVGLIRLPVPDYSFDGYREAISNAVLHRDYTRLGQVYVQWHPDHVLIANPGGFPEGITVDNILVHEPKPRNPRLADAFKRVGIVEQTGRGVDKIFMGQVRYGRPIPDYSRSAGDGVRVVLRGGEASLEFAALVYEQEKQGATLTLDDLIVLNGLFFERRMDARAAGDRIQKGAFEGLAVLEHLHERGLVEAQGKTRARVYTLSAHIYKRLHMKAEYVRAKGFQPLQCEQMILDYVRTHGRITRSEATELCHLTPSQASRLLRDMTGRHQQFKMRGSRRWSHYVIEE